MNKTPRIDTLTPGTAVVLDFGTRFETATFMGISGEGDERTAKFSQFDTHTAGMYEWNAYRFNRRWAYGSGAHTLRLVRELVV